MKTQAEGRPAGEFGNRTAWEENTTPAPIFSPPLLPAAPGLQTGPASYWLYTNTGSSGEPALLS